MVMVKRFITNTSTRLLLRHHHRRRRRYCSLKDIVIIQVRSYSNPHSDAPKTLLAHNTTITTTLQRPKTALFFPGQGNQKPGMLNNLLQRFPRTIGPFIELLDHTIHTSDSTYNHHTQIQPFSQIIHQGPASLLTSTGNAQPAILFTSLSILKIITEEFHVSLPKHIDYYLGHSLGEFTALVAAGIMKIEDALSLVRRRGVAMAEEAKKSNDELGMFAIVCPAEHLHALISSINTILSSPPDVAIIPRDKIVQIANHNSSTQIALSGHVSAIQTLLTHVRKFSGHDPRAIRLNVSAPFHSRLMLPVVDVIDGLMNEMKLNWKGRCGEVISNVTAEPFKSEDEVRELLPQQAVKSVRWWESIKYLENEKGVERWIGTGPGVKVGKGLVGREVKGRLIMIGEDMVEKEFEEVVDLIEGK